MRESFEVQYRQFGLLHFYKGLAPTLIRAFPVNAMALVIFDNLVKWANNL